MIVRLAASRTVVLNSTGGGSAIFAPERWPEEWKITRMSTAGASPTEPTLIVTRNGSMVDQTRRGNSAISETDLPLKSGETIIVTYANGTPGTLMTYYIEGDLIRGISN